MLFKKSCIEKRSSKNWSPILLYGFEKILTKFNQKFKKLSLKMTVENDDKKIEEIVETFTNTMKKGYMSGLILMILEKEPSHGYQIKNDIKEFTKGVWNPTSSTIYMLLGSLQNKELVAFKEEVIESGRAKKIYQITEKGKQTLKMLLQEQSAMFESIKSILLSTLEMVDATDESFVKTIEDLIYFPFFNLAGNDKKESMAKLPLEEQIDELELFKAIYQTRLNLITKNIEKIDSMLSKLKREKKNETIEQKTKTLTSQQKQA
ncbi:MAG: hypothetical protein GF383_13295 [Candidatus Lokiarchaeota archaeon]|nr:hypothetical protein [Candidatus Lokiarchaeota archaeon]MBD3342155.1 hypothetical protein [Candidatus Lokiarchaeota archaeon]